MTWLDSWRERKESCNFKWLYVTSRVHTHVHTHTFISFVTLSYKQSTDALC